MELQIVNKEIAIQLQELGFYKDLPIECDIELPTQALVCKWLRDKFDIEVYITKTITKQYMAGINTNNKFQYIGIDYITYEQAEKASILKAIKILKSK